MRMIAADPQQIGRIRGSGNHSDRRVSRFPTKRRTPTVDELRGALEHPSTVDQKFILEFDSGRVRGAYQQEQPFPVVSHEREERLDAVASEVGVQGHGIDIARERFAEGAKMRIGVGLSGRADVAAFHVTDDQESALLCQRDRARVDVSRMDAQRFVERDLDLDDRDFVTNSVEYDPRELEVCATECSPRSIGGRGQMGRQEFGSRIESDGDRTSKFGAAGYDTVGEVVRGCHLLAISKKLASSASPKGVRNDSGWNCTP